jgi:subtilisin family serine protease
MRSRTGKMRARSGAAPGRGRALPMFVAGILALLLGGGGLATAQSFRGGFGGGEGGFGPNERGFGERGGLVQPGTRSADGPLSGPDNPRKHRVLGGARYPSWRRPVAGCDVANCTVGRGGRWYPPIRRPGVFFPPVIYFPPAGEGVVEGEPEVPPGPARHPVRPVRPAPRPVAPSATVSRSAKRHPSAPPLIAVTGPNSHFVVPALTETRYVQNEVLVEIPQRLSPAALRSLERRHGLALIASQNFTLIGAKIARYRIAAPRSVAATVDGLRRDGRVAGAQPNYIFALQEDATGSENAAATSAAAPASRATEAVPGPAEIKGPAGAAIMPSAPVGEKPTEAASASERLQYAVKALHLDEAHRLATGKGIRIAVIDSGVDDGSAEIKDRVVARLDTIGGEFTAHPHGTAIAGAILAHAKLVGVAPDAQMIAIRAFTGEGRPDGAQGTSFHILQGLDFAAAQSARIVNMSFAGPKDALLSRALQALRAKGVTEIAAAGNGGRLSAPLYPGADAGVIAVTATDAEGQLFSLANHGNYIAMAAPGVDILAPAPGDTVQIVSGTSIAAAHVTGIAALALERFGSLAPDALLRALDAGSRKVSPEATPEDYGAGVVDAYGVVRGKPGADNAPAARSARAAPR